MARRCKGITTPKVDNDCGPCNGVLVDADCVINAGPIVELGINSKNTTQTEVNITTGDLILQLKKEIGVLRAEMSALRALLIN